jgi:hypothetical protein
MIVLSAITVGMASAVGAAAAPAPEQALAIRARHTIANRDVGFIKVPSRGFLLPIIKF